MTPEERTIYQREWRKNNVEQMREYRRKHYHRKNPKAKTRKHLYAVNAARKYDKPDNAVGGLFEGCTDEQIKWMTEGLNDKYEEIG